MRLFIVCYFRNSLNQLKVRRWTMYCHATEWIPTNFWSTTCPHCKRIQETRLTLDGICLKRQKKFVDKNAEERLIRTYYFSPIRRRLEF